MLPGNKNIYLSLIIFFLYSCTTTPVNSKIRNPPTKSFVKIYHTADIISCVDQKDPKCPVGVYTSMGSGMAINLIKGVMTVITAGHVCDVRPTDEIKNIVQTIKVFDHKTKFHQAWPIMITHNDENGNADLCLLWVPTLKVKKIKFSIFGPKVGEELYYVGAPMGIYHPPTVPIFKGIFSGVIDDSSSMITAPAAGGSSGSAVLNYRNEIVGIVWGTNLGFSNVSLMSNHKTFKMFLLNAKRYYQ
tara:strand:+ start:11419 stop:12153 length:735 start_codon:yes stop_codon:yes gene_type:complete